MSGLPMRIFSRRSVCRPFITPMITISALTAMVTPPMAITLISDSSFESAAAAQVAPRDGQLEAGHSGRSVGKRMTSRMFGVFVRYMNSRSMPMPTPPIGGMPYSMARR